MFMSVFNFFSRLTVTVKVTAYVSDLLQRNHDTTHGKDILWTKTEKDDPIVLFRENQTRLMDHH